MTTCPIQFGNVHRWFGDKHVLRRLDLTVRPGEVHALLGRNGCGTQDIQVTEHDALRFDLRITHGSQTLIHAYQPSGQRAHVLAVAASAVTLLRPPLLAAAPILNKNRGKNGLALASTFLMALLMAWLAHRRLTRLGASWTRAITWAALIVAGGLPVFVFYRLHETKRAWRWVTAPATAAARPLIHELAAQGPNR